MKRIHQFVHLPAADRSLLLWAAVLLCGIRIGLKLLPFQMFRRMLTKLFERPKARSDVAVFSKDRVVWAVNVASRYVLGTPTCLTRALATRLLLEGQGHSARVRIGVAKSGEGELQAHAWVESLGEVVIGGSDVGRYEPLCSLEGGRR